jgi:hypothetical protein
MPLVRYALVSKKPQAESYIEPAHSTSGVLLQLFETLSTKDRKHEKRRRAGALQG